MILKRLFILFFCFLSVLYSFAISTPNTDSSLVAKKLVSTEKVKVKDVEKLLNRRLSIKEKVALFLFNKKLIPKKLLAVKKNNEEDETLAKKYGKRSLLFGISSWVSILGSFALAALGGVFVGTTAATIVAVVGSLLSIFSIVASILAIVWGIMSLRKQKRNNTKGLAGLLLGGIYFLIAVVGLVVLLLVGLSIG